MPFDKKPAFVGFRAKIVGRGKPLLEKDIVPIQAEIVAQLDTIRELLVQKSKRLSHRESILEITTTWVGLDANQKAAVSTLKKSWPGLLFEGLDTRFWVGEEDEAVVLTFAVEYPENRFLTGRVLVTF